MPLADRLPSPEHGTAWRNVFLVNTPLQESYAQQIALKFPSCRNVLVRYTPWSRQAVMAPDFSWDSLQAVDSADRRNAAAAFMWLKSNGTSEPTRVFIESDTGPFFALNALRLKRKARRERVPIEWHIIDDGAVLLHNLQLVVANEPAASSRQRRRALVRHLSRQSFLNGHTWLVRALAAIHRDYVSLGLIALIAGKSRFTEAVWSTIAYERVVGERRVRRLLPIGAYDRTGTTALLKYWSSVTPKFDESLTASRCLLILDNTLESHYDVLRDQAIGHDVVLLKRHPSSKRELDVSDVSRAVGRQVLDVSGPLPAEVLILRLLESVRELTVAHGGSSTVVSSFVSSQPFHVVDVAQTGNRPNAPLDSRGS